MRDRPNIRQRSWSDYTGVNPIKGWVGKEPVAPGARFYADSSVYGPGGTAMQSVPEGYEVDSDTGGLRRKRKSRLSKARSELGDILVEGPADTML